MTAFVPCKKNDANGFIFYVSLLPLTASGGFQSNPTLAAGDVKISLDGGALANLNTLPVVTPTSSKLVKVTLNTTETNADNIAIIFSDQTSPKEWVDAMINFRTVARQVDDLAYPATSGRSLTVAATGEVSADVKKVNAVTVTGAGTSGSPWGP